MWIVNFQYRGGFLVITLQDGVRTQRINFQNNTVSYKKDTLIFGKVKIGGIFHDPPTYT